MYGTSRLTGPAAAAVGGVTLLERTGGFPVMLTVAGVAASAAMMFGGLVLARRALREPAAETDTDS